MTVLNESYYKVMQPLAKMTDEILSKVVYSIIPPDTSNVYHKPFSDAFVEQLGDEYGQIYKKIAEFINDRVPIVFAIGDKTKPFGMFTEQGRQYAVIVYVGAILKKFPSGFRREEITKHPKVRQTLLHELRHVVQFMTYRDYFRDIADTNRYTYNRDPVEIDASFTDILSSVNMTTNDLGKVGRFVNIVMDQLDKKKTLTPKHRKNYRRQAAKYFYDHIVGVDQLATTTVRDRLTAKKQKKLDAAMTEYKQLDKSVLRDLRNIGHGESKRFLLDSNIIDGFDRTIVKAIKDASVPDKMKLQVGFYLAMLAKAHSWSPASITEYIGIDMRSLSRNAREYFDELGFDGAFIARAMKKLS